MLIKRKSKSLSPPAKKWSQALDFSLKATTLPGKIADYSGPKKHSQICSKVSEDAIANGMNVPDSMVDYIIRRFFYRVLAHIKLGNTIILDDLGTLGMTPKERKKRIEKYEKHHYDMYELKMRINRRRERNKVIKTRFRNFNKKRVALGQKEWKFVEWSRVFKVYLVPRKYRNGWDKKKK